MLLGVDIIRFIRLLGISVFALPVMVCAQTLQEAVQIALDQYPTILAAQSRVDSAESDIIRAQSQHWPQVSWQGTNSTYQGATSFVSPTDTWIQSPNVTMNIWSGGRVMADVQKSRALSDSKRQQQRITRDEVAALATEGYLSWSRGLALVKLANENLAVHRQIQSDVDKIAQVDMGRRIDLDQARVRVENAELSLQQREAELLVARQRLLRMLLGRIPEEPKGIDHPIGVLPNTSEQALVFLNDNHPVIAQSLAQINAATASLRGAQSQYSPTVNFSYGKQFTQGTGQGDYVAQLTVNIPIFSGGATYGAVGTAQNELLAVEQDLREAKLTLRERLLSNWSDLAAAKKRVELGERQIKTAKQLVKGYEQQFRIGKRSLLDLLNVQSDLYNYQSNTLISTYDVKVLHARVLAAMGELALAYQKRAADQTLRAKQGLE